MDRYVRTARRGAVVLVALSSVLGGMLLAWHLVNPSTIAGTSTPELILVVGLLLLPLAAIGAWQMDRVATACTLVASRKRD